SPFTDEQVIEYLNKRFSDVGKRTEALKLVGKMHSLKFRPLLLSYIDLLVNRELGNYDSYTIYENLVDEWLNRELQKGTIKNKNAILNVCSDIAKYMYKEKKRDIDFSEVRELYQHSEESRSLEYMTIEGRSLLHR